MKKLTKVEVSAVAETILEDLQKEHEVAYAQMAKDTESDRMARAKAMWKTVQAMPKTLREYINKQNRMYDPLPIDEKEFVEQFAEYLMPECPVKSVNRYPTYQMIERQIVLAQITSPTLEDLIATVKTKVV